MKKRPANIAEVQQRYAASPAEVAFETGIDSKALSATANLSDAELLSQVLTAASQPNDFAVPEFAAKSKKQKTCSKGYSCGYSCINKSKSCSKPLDGQAATYADYMAMQAAKMTRQNTRAKAQSEPARISELKTADISPSAPLLILTSKDYKPPTPLAYTLELDNESGEGSGTSDVFEAESYSPKIAQYKPLEESGRFNSLDIPLVEYAFSANYEYSTEDAFVDPDNAVKGAFALRNAFREHMANLPNGQIVVNAPTKSDGKGDNRAKLYKRAGFGDMDVDGVQWAYVENGKLKPISPKDLNKLLGD